jgi:hypothetical protein
MHSLYYPHLITYYRFTSAGRGEKRGTGGRDASHQEADLGGLTAFRIVTESYDRPAVCISLSDIKSFAIMVITRPTLGLEIKVKCTPISFPSEQ